jgi:hypothetical protein
VHHVAVENWAFSPAKKGPIGGCVMKTPSA